MKTRSKILTRSKPVQDPFNPFFERVRPRSKIALNGRSSICPPLLMIYKVISVNRKTKKVAKSGPPSPELSNFSTSNTAF